MTVVETAKRPGVPGATWQGPRRIVSARLKLETVLVLEAAARMTTQSRSALVTRVLEDFATAWLERHGPALQEAVQAERAAREARGADGSGIVPPLLVPPPNPSPPRP